jgi:hypothetical protein
MKTAQGAGQAGWMDGWKTMEHHAKPLEHHWNMIGRSLKIMMEHDGYTDVSMYIAQIAHFCWTKNDDSPMDLWISYWMNHE